MAHIDACLTSVWNQTYENYEVIFVDNKSSDGSLEYAKAKFPSVTYVANQSNLGYAGGIVSGLAHSSGEYIAPLNNDTEVTPDWLDTMVRFLELNPGVGAVTPKILLFDQRDRINAAGINIHVTGLGFCRKLYQRHDDSILPEKVSGVSGCSYLIRRQLLEQLTDILKDCFMSSDDVILSWMLNLMGHEIYCLPTAVVFHKYHLRMDPEKLFHLEKNRQKLLLATLKPLTLVISLPIFLAIEFLIIFYSLVKGRRYVKAKLSTYASLWRERDRIRQNRERYQKLRRLSDLALFRRLNWNLDWAQLWHISR